MSSNDFFSISSPKSIDFPKNCLIAVVLFLFIDANCKVPLKLTQKAKLEMISIVFKQANSATVWRNFPIVLLLASLSRKNSI